jgi:hypothetical protein
MHTLKPDLEPLPPRLRKLAIDARGYPIPFFVPWIPGPDGVNVPEFRGMDGQKLVRAVQQKLCWICGASLGRWVVFPIGPMCAITRTTAEPPSHRDCAEWSVRNCPFLSQPRMVRRDEDLPTGHTSAGLMVQRNPGVTCLWITRSYEVFNDGHGKPLITVGEPEMVMWWREGRAASRGEVEHSIDSGMPALLAAAKVDGPFAIQALGKQVEQAKRWWPAA